jgi:hypothetical protein
VVINEQNARFFFRFLLVPLVGQLEAYRRTLIGLAGDHQIPA